MRVKIPRDRLTMCRWIRSHFHDCIDFYGVAFSAIFSRVTRINKRLPFHSGLVQKRTNMGSLIGHNIGQNTAEVLRSQLYLPRKNYLCIPRGGFHHILSDYNFYICNSTTFYLFFKHLSLLIATLQVYISLILYPQVGQRHPLIL